MSDWTITIEGSCPGADEALADRLIAALHTYAPAVGFGNGNLSLTVTMPNTTPGMALYELCPFLLEEAPAFHRE